MKRNARFIVVMTVAAIIVSFTSGAFASLTSERKIYQPPVPISAIHPRLSVVQGNKIHQIAVTTDQQLELQIVSLIDPAVPYVMGRVWLQMSAVYHVVQGRNWVYVLGDFKGVRCFHMINVNNESAPQIVGAVPVPADAFFMSLSRKNLAVIGKSTVTMFYVDNPKQIFIADEYSDPSAGFASVVTNGQNAYVLSHPSGAPSRVINFKLSKPGKMEKINSVPVSPFASELYLLDEFNDGYVLAFGTEEPQIRETYITARPKMEVKAHFDAFAITSYDGSLRPIQPPATSGREMIVAVTSCDNTGQMLYLAVQEWFWNERQGQFVSRPIIKQFSLSPGGFSLIGSSSTGVTYPTVVEQFGDGLYVYGLDFDRKPQLEIFQVRK